MAADEEEMILTVNANLTTSSLTFVQGVSSRKWMEWALYTLKSSRLFASSENEVVASAVQWSLPSEGPSNCPSGSATCLDDLKAKACLSALGWRSGMPEDVKLHKTP